jgi:hypothetical protein
MSFNINDHVEVTQIQTIQDPALGIMKWGRTNSFPQTLKNLIEESPSAKPAVDRTAKFYKGRGFVGDDEIVSPYGLTLKQVVSILADDLSVFKAFSFQCNFNLEGQVTGINPMRIATLRFNELDELNFASKIGYHSNFGLNAEVRKTVTNYPTKGKIKWINRFNPPVVLDQIAKTKGGIANYLGQILYYSETGHSSYPVPPLQAPINYVLADIENSILVRKETSTGFIDTYLLKTMLDSEDATLIALENSIEEAQGARGTGKVITMSNMSPEEMQNTVLEEIGSGGSGKASVIESATKGYELSQKVINGAYLIPPILSGADQKTGFSSADLADAYFVFNAVTQEGRDTIESELNKALKISIFNTKQIKIEKLTLDVEEEGDGTAAAPAAPSTETPAK